MKPKLGMERRQADASVFAVRTMPVITAVEGGDSFPSRATAIMAFGPATLRMRSRVGGQLRDV